jgi:hypothetical protein
MVKAQPALVEQPAEQAAQTLAVRESGLVPQPSSSDVVGMVERLAANPNVDVVKLEKIIELQERILAHNAKAEFDAAFSEMQGEIPIITEDGRIVVNGQLRSKYAKNEDIQRIVKPILKQYGFALRFRNEVDGNRLKVVGILSHRSGHSEQDEFVTAPDDSGSKNSIQAIGSARAYGQRYTTISLLNIATEGTDDDGRRAGKPEVVAPKGFDNWWADMAACVSDGITRYQEVWAKSSKEFRDYAMTHHRDEHERNKMKARTVQT